MTMTIPSLYKTHCKTFTLARELTGDGWVTTTENHPYYALRTRVSMRTPSMKEFRLKLAKELRARRNIWDLDEKTFNTHEVKQYMVKNGYDKGKHEKFKIGQTIEFWTGFNDHIRAKATIKGIDGDDIYVYNDCYWYPIQDDSRRKIK